MLMESPGPDRN